MAKEKKQNPTVEAPVVESQDQDVDMELVAAEAAAQVTDVWSHYQNYILGGIAAVAALIFLVFAYFNFYKGPNEEKATGEMYKAEQLLQRDSFLAALKGSAGKPGFVDIAKKYSGTKAGNLANLYAGQCYLQLGQFDAAITALKAYDADDNNSAAMAAGMLGDAYSELNKVAEATAAYQDACSANPNEYFAPQYLFKLGLYQEKNKKFAEAKTSYEKIKSEYPLSIQGKTIDMYISRVDGAK